MPEGATASGRRPGFRRRAGGAARSGAWGLARIVQTIARLLAAVLVVGILLVVLEANRDSSIVDAVLDAARFLAGPFDDMFKPNGAETRVAVNWGIAAAVYLIAGGLIARLLRR